MTKVLRGPMLTRYHANVSPDGRYLDLTDNKGNALVRLAKTDLEVFVAWMEKEGLIPREDVNEYGGAIRTIARLSEENTALKAELARLAHAE